MVSDGVDGLLCRGDEPKEWAQAIDRVLTDAALARRLGAAARATVVRRFALNSVHSFWVDWVESLPSSPDP